MEEASGTFLRERTPLRPSDPAASTSIIPDDLEKGILSEKSPNEASANPRFSRIGSVQRICRFLNFLDLSHFSSNFSWGWLVFVAGTLWIAAYLFVVTVSVQEATTTDRVLGHFDHRKLKPHLSEADPLLEDGFVEALDEWGALSELYPGKFKNFSDFILHGKNRQDSARLKLLERASQQLKQFNQIEIPPAPPLPQYSKTETYSLKWDYQAGYKTWPYVGSDKYMDMFPEGSRQYLNSLAVFPYSSSSRMHGVLGYWPNGTKIWKPEPMPPPIESFPGGWDAAMKHGGFFLNLSDALPLDRPVMDQRSQACRAISYDLKGLEDVSIIIGYYNEHISVLLRTIHSVLNQTPPPLLREIILVDDHSDTPAHLGRSLDEYLTTLPKVKLMRMSKRRGIVHVRKAGIQLARAPLAVVLDSHVEVNPFWLEPLAQRLMQNPRSVVFPVIMGISPSTFDLESGNGIGTFLSFKYQMQERPYFDLSETTDPIISASMAGGLFGVRRDWFMEVGGYDDEFSMWGAENVEMSFRVSMCGGYVEGIPCSLTYHIFRASGPNYKSPGDSVAKNRLRTAKLWLDDYWDLAKLFNNYEDVDIGPVDKMLALKKRLNCKPFSWFLKNIDPNRADTNLSEIGLVGSLESEYAPRRCIDTFGKENGHEPVKMYPCHDMRGHQGFFENKKSKQIKNMSIEHLCISKDLLLEFCQNSTTNGWRSIPSKKWLAFAKDEKDSSQGAEENPQAYNCLSSNGDEVTIRECKDDDETILWKFHTFIPSTAA